MSSTLEKPIAKVRTTRPCTHCGLPTSCFPEDENVFCCNGCLGAFALIHELGLDDYYALRKNGATSNLQEAVQVESRSDILEDLQAAGVAVHEMSEGLCSVRLAIDGLHCAACSWLIERMQPTLPGLMSAQVRMSDRTIELIYDPQQTKPAEVSRKLAKLGYSLSPWSVDSEDDQGFLQQQRDHWVGIALAVFFAANAMWIGVALYAGETTGISAGHEYFLRWVGTILAIMAVLMPGRLFFETAWQAIRTRTPHVDIPIALSLLIGVIGSFVGAIRGVGHIYFDSLASLILLLRIGRYIQFRAQYRTSLSLARLLRWNCVTASRIEADGSTKMVPASRLQVGDQIEVRSGESIPADGMVLEGSSFIDTSLLNGESKPMQVAQGDHVVGGTTNTSAPIQVVVTASGANSRIGKLMELVRDAATHRTPTIMAADRVSKWFILLILFLSFATFGTWSILANASIATQHTMALLTIACPCALALAAPLVLTVALGRGAKRQIWIRDADCLERMATPGTLWLDKTGTLTYGRMHVVAWHGDDVGLRYAVNLERSFHHPIAKAICEFASLGKEQQRSTPIKIEQSVGKGVQGEVDSVLVILGSEAWLREQGIPIAEEWIALQSKALSMNRSVVWLSIRGQVCGMFELGDSLREDAIETLSKISHEGWKLGILSGDRQEIVDRLAESLRSNGVPIESALGQQSPEDKLEVIRRCKVASDRPCAMVGDGMNDAAALAMADIGIAIRGGSEQALYAAPVFLANGHLASVAELLEASKCVVRGIRRCFAASLLYNTLTISLALTGWIHPLVAAVLMPISGLTVLTMAMSCNSFPERGKK